MNAKINPYWSRANLSETAFLKIREALLEDLATVIETPVYSDVARSEKQKHTDRVKVIIKDIEAFL